MRFQRALPSSIFDPRSSILHSFPPFLPLSLSPSLPLSQSMAYTQLKNALCSVLSAAVLLVAGGLLGLGSTLPVLAQESSEVGLPFLHNYSTEEYDASYQNWAIVQDKR